MVFGRTALIMNLNIHAIQIYAWSMLSLIDFPQQMWVYDEDAGLNCREVTFVPGLYKIFDEILGKWVAHNFIWCVM